MLCMSICKTLVRHAFQRRHSESSCNLWFRWSHPNCPTCLNWLSRLLAEMHTRHQGPPPHLWLYSSATTTTKVVQSSPAKATLSGPLQSHGWAVRGDSPSAWALYFDWALWSPSNVWNGGERIKYFSFSCGINQKQSEMETWFYRHTIDSILLCDSLGKSNTCKMFICYLFYILLNSWIPTSPQCSG